MKRWKPKKGEKYYIIYYYTTGTTDNSVGKVMTDCWHNELRDKWRYRVGNCFSTWREAQTKLNAMRKLLKERI